MADCQPGIDPGIMQKPIHAVIDTPAPASFFDEYFGPHASAKIQVRIMRTMATQLDETTFQRFAENLPSRTSLSVGPSQEVK